MILDVLEGFPSKPLVEIQRASHPLPSSIQDVSVNHSRSDIIVTQKFLDCPDVITVLQEMRGKGMPERVT